MSAADWSAVRLTAELAALTTVLLLLVGTPIAWWLARTRSPAKPLVAALVAMPLVLPPTVLGFYLLLLMGPQGPVGQLTQALGLGPAALHLCRAGGGLGAVLDALRRAAAAAGLRGHPRAHAGSRRHAARRPLGPLLQRRAAAGAARAS